METGSGDSLQLPLEIFGSSSNYEEETNFPNLHSSSSQMNDGMNKCPSSNSSSTSSDQELDNALRDMQRAVSHSQNVRKRKFFEKVIAGEYKYNNISQIIHL